MRLPVFKHNRHLRKKFSFDEGRRPRFGAFVNTFLEIYAENMQKHEVGKKKETIKKSGKMGFIEFPRPLYIANEG